jgi:hypothetical protein
MDALGQQFNALDQWLLQQRRASDADWSETEAIAAAKRGNFRPLANLFEHHPWLLGPQARALGAAQLRGRFRARRGRKGRLPSNQHGLNWWIARELPFIQEILRARYRGMPVSQTWVIKLVCIAYGIDETNFRNFLRGRHRPRHRP